MFRHLVFSVHYQNQFFMFSLSVLDWVHYLGKARQIYLYSTFHTQW